MTENENRESPKNWEEELKRIQSMQVTDKIKLYMFSLKAANYDLYVNNCQILHRHNLSKRKRRFKGLS